MFFYIRPGVVPIEMQFRRPEEKVPKERVVACEGTPWYEALTTPLTLMWQLVEDALVAIGISMLWAPDNPPEAPAYGYDRRVQLDKYLR
ncbi:hypothetical protein HanRHA438_Chr05g0223021 [Helianthus annuus]|uniref:Uncharacterized protein n=1 Tax=Helianthus annuus TaxID=4232 RepID=A0A9K3IZ35_HELAN|nr:hypothetical protein HanXRQr2_Chr05g0213661 [Helianthus annuus]KAJ0584501.1 hypothetical protein HanHA89_Chr05g0189361 [Helianthus annuus]KAJ0918872.1 hypothetical protein HanRHA438_Chr05g0223021 [Helianthus annuus]KAJ0922668.1 hypothetical protein HanPSC8_Chr05g0206561 [Helianthus annuus]